MDYKNKYFKYKKKYNNLKLTIEQEGGVNVNDLVKITDGNNKSCDQVKELNIYKGNIIKPGKIYFSINYNNNNNKNKNKIIKLQKGIDIIGKIVKLNINPDTIFNFKINNGIDLLWDDLGLFPILRNLNIQLPKGIKDNYKKTKEFLNENTTYNLNKDLQINVFFKKFDKNGIRGTDSEPIDDSILNNLLKNIKSIIESN